MKQEAVLVIGSANMDMVVTAEHFPQPGETILGKKFGMFPGGKGANQAVACAKLDGITYFIGKMGKDIFKEKLVQNMKNDGVNLDYLLIDNKESTGIALITVDATGENEIVVVSGSNMKLAPDEVASKRHVFQQVNVVLTQLEIPLETVQKAAELAKASSALLILNPAPARTLPEHLLKQVDFLTPNETELEILSGKSVKDVESAKAAAANLLKKGVKNIIVTLGEKGALLVNENQHKLFPTRQVTAVDTTAAGDAFNGALALSLAKGEEIAAAIQFANQVASFSVTRMGAQSSMPTRDEIEAWGHSA